LPKKKSWKVSKKSPKSKYGLSKSKIIETGREGSMLSMG
jgi:hypothetical protein